MNTLATPRQLLSRCATTFVATVFFAASGSAHAAPNSFDRPPALFGASLSSPRVLPDSPFGFASRRAVTRARPVNIDRALLTAAADSRSGSATIAQRITLNLFDDVTIVAKADQIERTARGTKWIGQVEGVDMSQVILIAHDDIVSGNISMPGGRYHIRFAGNGIHEVQKIDQSRFPRDEPFVPVPDQAALERSAARDALSAPMPVAQADDGSTIDVMVVYTAAARAGAFGTAAINSEIATAIAETNQSYANSGVTHRVRLVHAVEVAFSETGSLQDALDCITELTDGCLDNVHALRDTYGADLVSFWVERDDDGCGLGWMMSSISASFKEYGFSAVARSCATGYYSFGHEIGHNMGARHDYYMDTRTTPYSYSHGYVNVSKGWRTVMAYNDACSDVGKYCDRIAYWSNPSISYSGVPMGDANSDNRKSLNNSAATVANFRTAVTSVTPTASTVIEFYNSTLDHYFITANTSEAAAIDSGSAGPGWGRTGNTFKSGGSAQVCRFYGSISPGPNSHFYTVDTNECNSLKLQQTATPATEKRWNYESLDFVSTPATNKTCPSGTVPVYRAYNNGYAKGVDSNHRITSSATAIAEVVARGWASEGIVMCAPS